MADENYERKIIMTVLNRFYASLNRYIKLLFAYKQEMN